MKIHFEISLELVLSFNKSKNIKLKINPSLLRQVRRGMNLKVNKFKTLKIRMNTIRTEKGKLAAFLRNHYRKI